MLCSKCGKEIKKDSNYCYSCGSKIVEQELQIDSQTSLVDIAKYQSPDASQEKICNPESGEIDVPENIPIQSAKQWKKWGWGWLFLAGFYSNSILRMQKKYEVTAFSYSVETLGVVLLLICYFYLRNYLHRYYDSFYKPSIVSAILSLFFTYFVVYSIIGIASRLAVH